MRYIFQSLEIDEDSFAVRDGGAPMRVEPRVLEFLLYLIRHRQRMVSKGELLEHIWHRLAVGDAVITRCASKARQIVRDSNAIRTVYARLGHAPVLSYVFPSSIGGLALGLVPFGVIANRRRRKERSAGG